jgi:hypothetical protein
MLRLAAGQAAVAADLAVLIFGCLAPATLARRRQSLLVLRALAALRVIRPQVVLLVAKARVAA